MAKDDFLADKRTQQAVVMSFIIIGEAAAKVMDGYAQFAQTHADLPWRSMRNMRNRMAHVISRSTSTWCGTRCRNGCRSCLRSCRQCVVTPRRVEGGSAQ